MFSRGVYNYRNPTLEYKWIYLFGVLHRFQHCTGHITKGTWKGRGNQYIQLVKDLYCKLPTNGKQLPAFPLEVGLGTEPNLDLRGGRWECYHSATMEWLVKQPNKLCPGLHFRGNWETNVPTPLSFPLLDDNMDMDSFWSMNYPLFDIDASGAVVTYSPPTSQIRLWIPAWPHGVACCWSAAYSIEPLPTLYTDFLCLSNYQWQCNIYLPLCKCLLNALLLLLLNLWQWNRCITKHVSEQLPKENFQQTTMNFKSRVGGGGGGGGGEGMRMQEDKAHLPFFSSFH